MWNRLWTWFRSWRTCRQLLDAERMARDWERRSIQIRKLLKQDIDRLTVLRLEIRSLTDESLAHVQMAETIEEKHQSVVETLRSQIRILTETEVPGVLAAHRRLVQMLEAETAIQVRRQVAQMPGPTE